jgi:site-specific DNA recombinase
MLVNGQDDAATADPSLLRVIARAHDIQERLTQDTGLSAHDIARREQVSAAYIYTRFSSPGWHPTSLQRSSTANSHRNSARNS